MTNRAVVGGFEKVSIPQFGVLNVVAKVDTGAYSGALHCSDIKVVRRGPEKIRILKFIPLGKSKLSTETEHFMETYVRSSNGHRIKRFLIDTEIEIDNTVYPIRIGLSNRSEMKRPVLIGRRFLRRNNMIVDVTINQEYDDEGETTR
jgi:hypothetical protein